MIYVPQRRAEDGFLKRLQVFFKWFFIMTGIMTSLCLFSLVLITLWPPRHAAAPLSQGNVILTYTFKAGLAEISGGPSLSQPLLRPSTTFTELIDRLKDAAKDKHVKGFVVKLEDLGMSPAQLQELRDTLADFRSAGKFTYIYADDLGGFSSGMGSYYLASAFGQIWLQPVGDVSMNGVSAEVPFFKGILNKVGVEAEFSHKGIYKSMPESLTLTGMSAPHREMMTGLVNDLADQIAEGIAIGRGKTKDEVKRLINGAPYDGEEARKLKLIDKIGYYDQMLEEAKRKAGIIGDRSIVPLQDYSYRDAPKIKSKAKIALIIGAGDIISGKGDAHAGLSGMDMPADKIAKAFEDARKDKDVVAVVFRIDSPGGSPEASETIRHAIILTQQTVIEPWLKGKPVVVHKGKPVIVSMGGYAASGGYWIATPADKIVAEPATITGSIGVFGGKFVFAGLWQKLGIHWDSVASGENAQMFSANTPFTAKQLARFEALLDNIYQAFIARVAEGRHLMRAQVEAVAEGHVWTGRQAKDRGLVDALGGLDKAVVLAKVAAKIDPKLDVPLKRFPAKESTIDMIMKLVSGEDDDDNASVLDMIGLSAGDIARSLRAEVLSVPEIQVR